MLALAVIVMLLLPFTKLPAVAAFRLATCVVLVTVRGAVPVAMLLVNVLAVTAPLTLTPVPVTVKIAALPATPTVTLLLAVMTTLLLPFTKLPAVATFKLATCVVDVTVSGAVPVAMLLVKLFAVTAALTLSAVSVPTLVIFG